MLFTVSSCTQSSETTQSVGIPTMAITSNETNVEDSTSTAPPQPTSLLDEPSTTVPETTNVPASPSPHPPKDTPTQAPEPISEPIRFVIDPEQSSVSYGVGEIFISENNRYNYAVGVTSLVSGEILVDSVNPAASKVGGITVDISAFHSDKSRRDKAIRDRWLQSSKFPLAFFSPMEIHNIPKSYTPGQVLEIEVAGDLIVREISQPTVFAVTVSIAGEQLTGKAVTRVQMSDFGFEPPTIAGIIQAENDVDIVFEFVALPVN